tara:strand:- start:2085 stop:2822 length:738 start_codon:yes stop_codon:yes gene_type:complete
MSEIETEDGTIEEADFDWGFSFSDTDEADANEAVVTKTTQAISSDLGPITQKLDAIIALIPAEGVTNTESVDVDLSSLENKLDQIIALEKVDALTAGDMPDMTPIQNKLDVIEANQAKILAKDTTVNAPEVNVDLSSIEDKLDTMEQAVNEVRELDFDGDGQVDFGDINNNLADLLARQEASEAELEAKKTEFEEYKTKKLKALEKLIIPLLRNLKSNPDKAYIHWPGRAPVLDAQISKILALTR